jgi:hypothetical protein
MDFKKSRRLPGCASKSASRQAGIRRFRFWNREQWTGHKTAVQTARGSRDPKISDLMPMIGRCTLSSEASSFQRMLSLYSRRNPCPHRQRTGIGLRALVCGCVKPLLRRQSPRRTSAPIQSSGRRVGETPERPLVRTGSPWPQWQSRVFGSLGFPGARNDQERIRRPGILGTSTQSCPRKNTPCQRTFRDERAASLQAS